MALAPQAAPAPMSPPAGSAPPMPGADPMAPDTDEGGEPTVLATIMLNPDGSLQLVQGDEQDEPGEGTPAEEGAEGQEPTEAEDKGQTFDAGDQGRGKLLNAINEMLDTASGGGKGAAQDAFVKGYNGDDAAGAMPPKGM